MPITYNYAAINDVAGAVAHFTGNMDQELNDLYVQFTQLFAQDWSGQAGQAVDAARARWNAGALEIKTALATMGQRLGQSAENMQALDRQIANEVHL